MLLSSFHFHIPSSLISSHNGSPLEEKWVMTDTLDAFKVLVSEGEQLFLVFSLCSHRQRRNSTRSGLYAAYGGEVDAKSTSKAIVTIDKRTFSCYH